MKAVALFTLLFCGQVMAKTFIFSDPANATFQTDRSYVLMPEVVVDIGSVTFTNNDEAKVYLRVNGKGAQYEAKVISGNMFLFGENKYEVIVKTDVLKDQICGELETVSYELTFTEVGEYDHFAYITGAGLKAVKSYTYDACHAYTEYSDYEYKVN